MATTKQQTKAIRLGRIIEIPAEHHLALRRDHDALMACPPNQGLVAHYNLWQFLAEIAPEVKESPYFTINFVDAFTIRLEEHLPA